MSDNKEHEENPAPEENNAEVAKTPENRVEVSGELLNEAVSQLRKMAEIRQRDSERQERAIAQMQTTLKRGRILSRYVIFSCLVVMVISVGLAYLMWQSASSEKQTANTLIEVNDSLQDATKTIAEETQKQVTTLTKVREAQERSSSSLEQELRATREIQSTVINKVDEQLGAVREERDQIAGEVRNLLEEKTEFYIAKEKELEAEREAIKDAKERSKEEQKELINDTIARLNAMAVSLDGGAEVTATDVEEAVSAAEEAMAEGEAAEEVVETEAAAEETAEEAEEAVEDVEEPAEEAAVEETVEEETAEAVEAPEEASDEIAEEAESAPPAEVDIEIEWVPGQ